MVEYLLFWATALFYSVFILLYGSQPVRSAVGEEHIICFGELPPHLDPKYGFYGSPLSMVANYDNLTSLCAGSEQSRVVPSPKLEFEANPGAPFWQETDSPRGSPIWNIGIMCEKSKMTPRQYASADKQEQQQWEATLQYCLDRCICTESYIRLALCLKGGLGSSYDIILRDALTRVHGGTQSPVSKTCNGLSAQECVRSLRELSCSSSTLQAMTDHPDLPLRPVSTQKKNNDGQCGTRCSNFHCRNHGVGCRCLARELVQGVFNRWSCGIPGQESVFTSTTRYGGRKVKRSVEYAVHRPRRSDYDLINACPCNQTYVSQSCCEAVDGIVHEPSWLNLGSLKM